MVKSCQSYLKYRSNYVVEISLIMDIDQIDLKIFTIQFKDEGKTNVESIFLTKGIFFISNGRNSLKHILSSQGVIFCRML